MHRSTLTAGIAIGLCVLAQAQAPVRVTTAIEWAGRGVWLKGDFHTQTKFTDGGNTVDEVVAAGVKNGCDVVAITDHGDGRLKGATPEYFDAINNARAANPKTVVITGLEWNVPPGKGQEHATILFPTAMANIDVIGPFKARFDDARKEGDTSALALEGLAALTPSGPTAVAPVMFFNHPTRRPESPSLPKLTFAGLKKAAPAIVIGFEGAPGHQRSAPLGAYPESVALIDRWDPVVAQVGGVWDDWLRDGLNAWGAIANSDFHYEAGEFWPCEFSTTWVYAPERSVEGVIRALRAGSFLAEHGHIVTEALLEARFPGQPHVFQPGETASTPAGAIATVRLRLKVPERDYLGRPNRIDSVELIGISASKTELLFSGAPGTPAAFNVDVTIPPGGIVLRARGRRALDDGSGLMFYTNPIRITTGS